MTLGQAPAPYVIACDADPVVDARGESLGVLAHLMLDATHGHIAYAVIGRGGVLGVGETLHAVPWSAFTLDAERGVLVLDIDGDGLDAAPGFDGAHWPGTPQKQA